MYTNKDIKSKEMMVYKKVSKINEMYFTKTKEPINLMDKFLTTTMQDKFILIKDGFEDKLKNTVVYVSNIQMKNEKTIEIELENDETIYKFTFDLNKKIDILGFELKPILEYYNVSPFKDIVPYGNYLETFFEVLSN